jgi:calcium-dependent protein kinase
MLTGHFPFSGKTNDEVFEKILSKNYESKYLNAKKCSTYVKDLIAKLLVKKEDERISIDAALCHPWFKYYLSLEAKNPVDRIDEEIISSLKAFTRKNLFQKEVMFYIAKLSREEEIKKLKKAFLELDTDNTGTLDYEEIHTAFNKLGIKIKDVIKII